MNTRIFCLSLVALGALGLGACTSAPDAPGDAASATDAPVQGTGAAPADAGNAAAGAATAGSGTSAAPAAKAELSLLEKGRRRTVGLKEAIDGLGGPLFEPKRLPKDSVRSVVHLIELIEGIENPALPAVRQIWDLAGGGSLILVQSQARGDLGGEANLKVGDADAYLSGSDQKVLVFERDGAQFELRSAALTAEQLQEIAASLEAVDPAQAEDGSSGGGEDLGAILSGAEGTAAVAATVAVGTVAPPAATAKP